MLLPGRRAPLILTTSYLGAVIDQVTDVNTRTAADAERDCQTNSSSTCDREVFTYAA